MLKIFFDWLFRRQKTTRPASPRLTNPQDFAQLNRDAPLRAGGSAGTAPGVPARTASSATDDSTDGADSTPAMVTYLCREAVLGRDQRIAGYQFMLHEGTRNRIRNSSRRVHHLYAEVLVRAPVVADVRFLAARAAQTASAWHAARHSGYSADRRRLAGAALGGLLFLSSDALLAINRFHTPLPMASLWILASYWAAQWLIASALAPRR